MWVSADTGPTRSLQTLDVDECMRLLTPRSVGRLAVRIDERLVIVPVNYLLHDGTVVFRTTYGPILDALNNRTAAAFEVDDIDFDYHEGWSVLVQGRGEEITDPVELERCRGLPLRPWAPGEREHYVRILSTAISGRRIA